MKIGDTVDVDATACISKEKGLVVSRVFSWKWVKVNLEDGLAAYVRASQCLVTADAVEEVSE